MRTVIRNVRQGVQLFATALARIAACIGACIVACGATVEARAAVALYEATVPLQGATAEARAAGMAEALRAVAVQASGRRDAATNPTIGAASPERYVQRYSTTAGRMLKVGFDGPAIERLLQQAGLPLWPAERPRIVIDAPVADRAAVESVALWRGLTVDWAAGAPPLPTPGRAVLSGVPGGGEFAWTFTHEGRTTGMRGSPAAAVHFVADTLAARYAPASTRSTSDLTVRVDGMDGLADYSGLLAYLGGLSLVRGVEVDSLDGTVITLRVAVRGDRELLGRIVALDGRLQPVAPVAGDATPAVDFVYSP
jgi:hypothetical protein